MQAEDALQHARHDRAHHRHAREFADIPRRGERTPLQGKAGSEVEAIAIGDDVGENTLVGEKRIE